MSNTAPASRPPGPPGGQRQFIDTVGWRAATSPEYQNIPHEYTVRSRETAGKPPQPEWFDWFASMIREHGYRAPFTNPNTKRTWTYTYMDFEGFKYWHMGQVINREPLPKDGP
jgi:hypothetical protein